jgi:hypothetical protein
MESVQFLEAIVDVIEDLVTVAILPWFWRE